MEAAEKRPTCSSELIFTVPAHGAKMSPLPEINCVFLNRGKCADTPAVFMNFLFSFSIPSLLSFRLDPKRREGTSIRSATPLGVNQRISLLTNITTARNVATGIPQLLYIKFKTTVQLTAFLPCWREEGIFASVPRNFCF